MDDSCGTASSDRDNQFITLIWSKIDLALWFQWILGIAALVSIGDIAWEYQTGVADVYSKVSTYTARRATHPDAFQRIITLEIYRTVGIAVVGLALMAVRKSTNDFDIFAPGREFKSLDEKGKP
jgi:hypothetical protein